MPIKLPTILFLSSLCLGALAQTPVNPPDNPSGLVVTAGKVDLVEGEVRILDKQQKPRTVNVGDSLYEGDSVVTGADGELHVTMEDEGFIAVRPNTKMRISEFRAQGDDQDKGVFGLMVGSMRSVTGWIGKYHPRSYSIRTPNATIGIRGTDHEPMVIAQGSTDGEAGTYDKVNIGGSYIQTSQGRIEVSERRAAFAPHFGKRGALRPRLLEGIPHFYRPTRNERLIDKKHEFIQRIVKQRREERRQKIRERLKPLKNGKASAEEGKQDRAEKRAEMKNERQKAREERRQKNGERRNLKKKRGEPDEAS